MQPTTAIVANQQTTPDALEKGESRTAIAMGRKWTLWPESGASVGDSIIYIFSALLSLALTAAWIAGAIMVSRYKKHDDTNKTHYQIGLGLLIGGLIFSCCGVGGIILKKTTDK